MSVLQGILGRSKKTQPTIASGVQLQTSAYGAPIPLAYGTNRMTGNVLWYGDFVATAQPASGGGKGGAFGGGGGGKGGPTNYIYSTAVALGLCEGPIQGINNIYSDKNLTTLSALGYSLFTGTYPQTAWSYLTTNHPVNALDYNGIAYVANPSRALGNSPQMPNDAFEVQGIFSNSVAQQINGEQDVIPGTPYQITVEFAAHFTSDAGVTDTEGTAFTKVSSPSATYQYSVTAGVYTFYSADVGIAVNIYYNASIGPDADPSLVVNDILTNPHYGAGFPSANVGSLAVYQEYCIATGLLISPFYISQEATASMLTDIATNTNSEWVWSSGTLNLVPYGDQTITANGYTYTAPSAPLYSLTVDQLCNNMNGAQPSLSSEDPISLKRLRPADQINSIKLECLDRNNQYNSAIVEAKDQALIDTFGLRQSSATSTHLFCNLGSGRISAQLQLQRQGIRNIYGFTLDQRYIVLDPMDIISLTDTTTNGLGLNNQWVRIISVQENDDSSVSFTAEEYLQGTGNAPLYSFGQGRGYTPNYNQSPGNTNTPVIFVPPIELAATGLEVWLAVSGIDQALWGGCDVWISQDGENYKNTGRINGNARMGLLTAPLASGSDPDTTHTLSVNLTQSSGELSSGTQADADNFNTLCYVNGELLSFETATLTSAFNYNLTYLRRGAYGTTISAHSSATQFARLDNGIFTYPINKGQIGTTVYIKLTSFNLWQSGEQSLSDVSAITFVVPFPPAPAQVQNFSVQQQGAVVVFKWTDLVPYDTGLKGYDIAYGALGSPWAAKQLLTEAARATEMTNAAVPPGTWEFSIRAHDIADQLGPENIVQLIVTNPNTVIATSVQEPQWLGTLNNFYLHWSGVLVPLSTHTPAYYAVISAPAAPTLSQVTSGALTLGTLYAKITYVDATGESLASSESSLLILPGNVLQVASPATSGLAVGYNIYVGSSSGSETLQNAAPIGLGSAWTMPVTGLVSGAVIPTVNTTGFQPFDEFVPDPVSSASYTSPTIDTGYNADLRVYASSAASLGMAQTGSAAMLSLSIDTWLTGQSDPNVYTPWTIGFVEMRYLNARITYGSITAGDVSYITDFTPTVDTAPSTESAESATVAPGGSVITFPTPFHQNPFVQATVVSGTALYSSVTAVSTTQFTAHVWNSSGSDVGGVINWSADGS